MKTTLILAGAAALMLSACGRMAELEAPQARQTERAPRDANAPAPVEPATINRPSSQVPIDGGASNPFGAPPPIRAPG